MTDLNLQLFHWINLDAQSSPLWFWLARISSTVLPPALLVGAVGALCWPDAAVRRQILRVLLAMLLAWGVARGLSALWPTPRPFVLGVGHRWLDHKPTPSFPSSHASVAFAFGFALWLVVKHPVARWAPLLLAALVAWSRVALGVHFPVDALAGALVGGFSAWLAFRGLGPRQPSSVAHAPADATDEKPPHTV